MGCIPVCGSGGAESDLGARGAQPGAGRLPDFAGSSQFTFSGQGAGKFSFCHRARSPDDTVVHSFLQTTRARPGMDVDSHCRVGHMGAGGKWHVLRGDVAAHPGARNHAAVAAVPYLSPCYLGYGARHDGHSYGG